MTLIEQIANKRLDYRKRGIKDQQAKAIGIILTTLYGEAAIIGKNAGGRQTTDDEVVKVIKKFIKGVEDNKKYRKLTEAEIAEIATYNIFLPTTISSETITTFATKFLNQYNENITMRCMGLIMSDLKDNFPGQVDGKMASEIIKTMLKEKGA